jgi:hypothetical protein
LLNLDANAPIDFDASSRPSQDSDMSSAAGRPASEDGPWNKNEARRGSVM